MRTEANSQFIDPCEKASKASLDCLERTHYNKGEVSLTDTHGADKYSATSTSRRTGNAKRTGWSRGRRTGQDEVSACMKAVTACIPSCTAALATQSAATAEGAHKDVRTSTTCCI